MSKFSDWFKRGQNADGSVPYYEDTHDASGNYIGGNRAPFGNASQMQTGFAQPAPAVQPQTGFAAQPMTQQPIQPIQPVQTAQGQVPPMYTFIPMQAAGAFVQPSQAPQPAPIPPPQAAFTGAFGDNNGSGANRNSSLYTAPLSGSAKQSAQRPPYSNVVVYEPRTPEEVQTLIDYLTRREPAIINLDNIDVEISQRVLDFVSGAIYALGGTVHRVSGNIFLLSPEGVEINTIE